MTTQKIDFTRINNDFNGNPRYVCSWLNFNTKTYEEAVKLANTLGGKKFHNKQYGGGLVFQSYNIQDLENSILEAIK